MKKSQLVKILTEQILKEVSLEIKSLIREEFEINKRILKRELLLEMKKMKSITNKPKMKKLIFEDVDDNTEEFNTNTKKNIDTGDDTLNSILAEIDVEQNSKSFNFDKAKPINEVVSKRNEKNQVRPKIEQVIHKFDPATMDASEIDWSSFVTAMEKK